MLVDIHGDFKTEGENGGCEKELELGVRSVGKEVEGEVCEENDEGYPSGVKLLLTLLALFITELSTGLDQTIVAAAIPKISNDFNVLNQVGWYGSAYLLTSCSLQPLFGRAYDFFPQKLVFIFALLLLEIGSIVSAVSQSSPVFVLGRALQGCGYAGLFIGALAIGSACLPPSKRPLIGLLMGLAYGVGAVLGPLLGGILTSKLSWRWCFWINLPPGAITAPIVYFFCHPPLIPQTLTIRQRLRKMDWVGAVFLLSSTVCLLLALQNGGIVTPWKSAKIIGLLVGFVMILIAFFFLQYYLKEDSSISMRLLGQKNVFAIVFFNFTVGATYFPLLYYVPVYFQAIEGSTPIRSGVQTLPLILGILAGNIGTGWSVTYFGTYYREMLFGAALSAIGSGLLGTMDTSTGTGKWIAWQLLAGLGTGSAYMQGYVATQASLPVEDRARGASISVFTQLWGATAWVSASEAIYQCQLLAGIVDIPGLDIPSVVSSGLSKFRDVVPAQLLPKVVDAAAASLFDVFVALAAMSSIGFLAIFWMDWAKLEK